MIGRLDRIKVVIRQLPRAISHEILKDHIDGAFAGRYNCVSIRPPGKTSGRRQAYSSAYIDFKRPDDVLEFAEFFNGHLFVDEKGTQFKTVVEYAPSQRVAKHGIKKDRLEGTINEDPEYMEFLESLSKPVQNLPSAEIQLERREAERAGAVKNALVVTPLMEFVRQKRATKTASQRSSVSINKSNGRPSRSFGRTSSSASSKRGSERRRVSTPNTKYINGDTETNSSGKNKLVSKPGQQLLTVRTSVLTFDDGTEALNKDGKTVQKDGVKKSLLIKGKEREISDVYRNISKQDASTSSAKSTVSSPAARINSSNESERRMIESPFSNKDAGQRRSFGDKSEKQSQVSNVEHRRPPRPANVQLVNKTTNGTAEAKVEAGSDSRGFGGEKMEKGFKSRDRSGRRVWTLRRSDGVYASDDSLSSSASKSVDLMLDSAEGKLMNMENDPSYAKDDESRTLGSRHSSNLYLENVSYKHVGHNAPLSNAKDSEGLYGAPERKHGKRGNASGNGSHEKQVWVQKSSFVS